MIEKDFFKIIRILARIFYIVIKTMKDRFLHTKITQDELKTIDKSKSDKKRRNLSTDGSYRLRREMKRKSRKRRRKDENASRNKRVLSKWPTLPLGAGIA